MAVEMKSGGDILRYPSRGAAPLVARWALDHDGLEGKSFVLPGILRRHCLQYTTKVLRVTIMCVKSFRDSLV